MSAFYVEALATELQREGSTDFAKSWNDLMRRIGGKIKVLAKV